MLKKLARNFGIELKRFTPATSEIARMQYLFAHHQIDCVLDVGANIGQYGQYLREIGFSGKIVSFEPLSSAHSKLELVSKKDSLWKVAPRAAIGNTEGEIEINIAGNSESSSVLQMLDSHKTFSPDSGYISSEKVKLSRLDNIAQSYIQDVNSIYLKIDTQGFEIPVLEGACQILPKVKGIQVELSLIPLYKDQPLFNHMLEKMAEIGYELYAVIPVYTDMKTGRLMQMDGVFFKQ